ncbi:MAG: Xaa-Pro peptidase family protein [Candidatus Omnitrophota bacterium]|nr:Xaa-Pro peptidase family protein [Candidatus Omnitrophota bacterium]
MDHKKRQKNLIKILKKTSLDALIIRKKQNIAYLTGTRGEDAILFTSGAKNCLITDSRYKEEYADQGKNCGIWIMKQKKGVACSLEEISRKTRAKHIGFEEDHLRYSEYKEIKKKLKNKNLVPVKGVVENLRMIKDSYEITHIKNACKYGSSVMNHALKIVKPGETEKHIKNRLNSYIVNRGLNRADFELIVASGKNASMPHAVSSNKKIKSGEMIVIDLGIMNYGYNSDLTRTVFLGRIDPKYRRIYNIVLEAQKRAIEHIKPGVSAGFIDSISRQYISNKGLGRYFIHSLGHGLGLETHEIPSLSTNNNTILEKDMVITVEPGVYIPGWGGIRIEDDILITKNGCEVLTNKAIKHKN